MGVGRLLKGTKSMQKKPFWNQKEWAAAGGTLTKVLLVECETVVAKDADEGEQLRYVPVGPVLKDRF
jgi:hypothetical protein